MELPKRKQNRLTEYDYSTPNAYFITICTEKRKNLFWMDVGAIIDRPKKCSLDQPWDNRAAEHREYSKILSGDFCRSLCDYAKSYSFTAANQYRR